ncbi:MAG: ACP S-malonyltransferase [Isosphaeraceae bacterium]
MADGNVEGHLKALVYVLETPSWQELWTGLDVEIMTFDQLNLSKDVSDVVLWRSCQHRDVVPITGNRNDEGPDSLEAAIRLENTDSCLPVLTISDPARIFTDRLYAEHVAERLLETILDIEVLRGAGRVYLP